MTPAPPARFLVITFPLQGHINPSLQFSKRLSAAAGGAPVTFVTTIAAHRRMSTTTSGHHSISYAPFSDGYDDGVDKPDKDLYLSEFRRRSSQAISDLVSTAAAEGRPYTCLVYTLLLPWTGIIAESLGVQSFLLWIQPVTIFDIYYYYFHGYEDALKHCSATARVTVPGLSLQFSSRDIPSFMVGGDEYFFLLESFREQFEVLEMKSNPKILVNTFDELETDALRAIVDDRVTLIGIGPLIPSAFLDKKDPSDTSFGADLFNQSKDECKVIEWLSSKPKSSVIYVSFGSMSVLSNPQMEEIAKGLLACGHPFLWVVREEAEKLSCKEELEKLGLIVPWCGQVEVLSNEAVGCFVSHCGWNSTLESLVAGVPVVAFPQWSDQGTNAKLIEEVWRTGVRLRVNENDGTVKSEEIKRCVDVVLKGEEFRSNAKKWSCLARESSMEGGSSDRNLKAFLAEVVGNGIFKFNVE